MGRRETYGQRQARTRRRTRSHGPQPCACLHTHRGLHGRGRLLAQRRAGAAAAALEWAARYASFDEALRDSKPDVVSINTFPDTHAAFAIRAMEAGAHVFVEKPLAETVAEAQRVVETAVKTRRKLVVRLHPPPPPSWMQFIEIARTLGTPLVFRMNLNQQSSGPQRETHKRLMGSLSPIVDCGVHYVDVWCQITTAKPVAVHAVGARLTDDLPSACTTTATST